MACIVYIVTGGPDKGSFSNVQINDPNGTLGSLSEIVKELIKDPKKKQELSEHLQHATTLQIEDPNEFFKGKRLIYNASYDEIERFTGDSDLADKIQILEEKNNVPYPIVLGQLRVNGKEKSGRVKIDDQIFYILSSTSDVERFVNTESIKRWVIDNTENGEIKHETLNSYQDKLNTILTRWKKIHPDLTLQGLIEDFLDNKDKYKRSNILVQGEYEYNILSNFCNQILGNELKGTYHPLYTKINSNLEAHKNNSYSNSYKISKQKLFNIIKNFVDVSKETFTMGPSEEIKTVLNKVFRTTPGFNGFEIIGMTEPYEQEIEIPTRSLKKLINELDKKHNSALKKGSTARQTNIEDLNTVEKASDFFNGVTYTDSFNKEHSIIVRSVTVKSKEDKETQEIHFYYKGYKLSNNDYVYIAKGPRQNLHNRFGYTNTNQIFYPVNTSGVTNGYYKGFYIYKGNNMCIVSNSVIAPELVPITEVKTVDQAIQAIENFIHTKGVIAKNSHMNVTLAPFNKTREIRFNKNHVKNKYIQEGQAISIINYNFENSNLQLPQFEGDLFNNKNIVQVKEEYKKLGVDISSLESPQEVGTFIYAMVDKGYVASDKQKIIDEKENIDKLVETIHNKAQHPKLYLIESLNKKNGKAYLKLLNQNDIEFTSKGRINDKPYQTWSKSESLTNTKKALETGVLADTNISIVIQSGQEIEEQLKGEKININMQGVRAFVHNNTIYINSNLADPSDMLHETMHIALGVIKVKNPELYRAILEQVYKNIPDTIKKNISDTYVNLAQQDQMEEAVVAYLASQAYNSMDFYTTNPTTPLQYLGNQIAEIKKTIERTSKTEYDNDITFGTLFKDNDALQQAQLNRKSANAIKNGIENNTITEECD